MDDDLVQHGDRGAQRVGDAQRDATVDVLRDAVADGRLTLEEFGDRAGASYAATTVADLEAVVADLGRLEPAPGSTPVPVPPPIQPPAQRILAVMGGAQRRGHWQVGSEVSAMAIMGGVELDLYEADLAGEVTTIRAFALMGAVEVLVPEGVPVQVEGSVLMGAVEDRTVRRGGRQRPMVRVVGHGMWGAVAIRHRKGERRGPVTSHAGRERGSGSAPTSAPALDGDTVTVLFTDIVDSTSLAERLGDQRWFGVLSEHNAIVREQVARHGGEEIKNQGDGFMIAFRSARRALLAAVDIQRALGEHRRDDPQHPVHVRIGLHTGEVVSEDGDLHGRNVVLASRIAATAGRDEVLASALTKQLAESGGDLIFGSGRAVALKGLSGEWMVHPVEWSAS